jgi:type IV secretory pathway component VirB8
MQEDLMEQESQRDTESIRKVVIILAVAAAICMVAVFVGIFVILPLKLL